MKAFILLTLFALQANKDGMHTRNESASYLDILKDYAHQLVEQAKPFAKGALGGAGLGALQTEVLAPVLNSIEYDSLAVAAELGLYGGAGYVAYDNQDNEVVQSLKNPATLAGVIAGILGWHNYDSIIAWVKG